MKHFDYLNDNYSIFYRQPQQFNLNSDKEFLSYSLGSTLYMGGDRNSLLKDILSLKSYSVAICLEDSVSKDNLSMAEQNVINLFNKIDELISTKLITINELPLIFVRVRNLEQLKMLMNNSSLNTLCGIIIPKFNSFNGEEYLDLIKFYNRNTNRNLYVMPVLETPEIIYKETRFKELLNIKDLIATYNDMILNIRVGGTDFSGIYSLRRSKNCTIYDLSVINDCLTDILNLFQRDGYVMSAPVNEHFNFENHSTRDTFVKEVLLDKCNGFVGKTIIHPYQAKIANSIFAVTKEDYLDALAIINSSSDGVIRSFYKNKMNEVKPHFKWAKKTMLLSKSMGVLNDEKTYRDILEASGTSFSRTKSTSIT
ncbi:HpcH/HpaI aldolase/citrate lyase family protein [Clostridium sp. DL1XJH146]